MYFLFVVDFGVDWWALGVLSFEMLVGRSPFDIVGQMDNPDQNTEDYLFQGQSPHVSRQTKLFYCSDPTFSDLTPTSPVDIRVILNLCSFL